MPDPSLPRRPSILPAVWRAALTVCGLWVAAAGLDAPVSYAEVDPPRFELDAAEALPDRQIVAVAIGGTGPRALAAIGVLKTLEAAGIRPNLVIGSGTGAIIGVLYAAGYSGADLEELALTTTPWRLADPVLAPQAYVRGDALRRWLDGLLDSRRIEELGRPFAAVVTHLETGTLEILNRGRASVAACASNATPGVLFPVRIDGESFGDGQLVSPLPIRVARQFGADIVIAIDVAPAIDAAPSALRRRPRTLAELTLRQSLVDLEVDDQTVVARPELGWRVGYDLPERRRAILAGEAAGMEAAERLRALVEPAHGNGRHVRAESPRAVIAVPRI